MAVNSEMSGRSFCAVDNDGQASAHTALKLSKRSSRSNSSNCSNHPKKPI